jgi:hypothetical protein
MPTTENKPEVWQRGVVANVPALLQPVAHALMQAGEELDVILKDFPPELLYKKPFGLASVSFHLRHLTGVLDRLFTYARNEALSDEQLLYLKSETVSQGQHKTIEELINGFHGQVAKSLMQLQHTQEASLTELRTIGRKKIPTTTIGLLFHAAELSMRHIGQLFVTVKVLKSI